MRRPAVNAWAGQDTRPGDILVWPSSLGWMMGPWLIFAALLNRATLGVFNGAPTTRKFGLFVDAAQATMLGVVPSIVRAWRSSDCMQGIRWQSVRSFSSSGEVRALLLPKD